MGQPSDASRDALAGALHRFGRAETHVARVEALGEVLAAASRQAHEVPGELPLLALCEADAAARAALTRGLSELLRASSPLGLLAEGGLPNDRGLLQETGDRLARRLLPEPPGDGDLGRELSRALRAGRAYERLERMDPAQIRRLAELLVRAGLDWRPLRAAALEALLLLSTRIAALGLTEPMRARMGSRDVAGSPFQALAARTQALVERLGAGDPTEADLAAWRAAARAARVGCEDVHAHLEQAGVSLDLVFAIDYIAAALERMERILAVLAAPDREAGAHAAAGLWLELERARRDERGLRALLRQNTRLLSRRIVERAGRTGEHYIAATRREYAALALSSAGGGLLTTFTAAVKLLVHALGGPLFVSGLLASLNYAASFVLIQHTGATLATKQPAMTAATLADIMHRVGPLAIDDLVTHVARIVRSQLAAAVANVACVAAGSWLFALLWQQLADRPFLDEHEVEYVLGSLHPGHSLTIFYAALTGVILWASSLVGGSIENWAVYRGLPEALAGHRRLAWLGPERQRRLARFMRLHLSGWGVNVSLGFLLGMTPALGAFFGLPLDVRHVTLTTGMLALAAFALPGAGLGDVRLLPALFGIAVIFVLNLTVSFGLALAVALRAREVQPADRRALLRALLRRMLRSPLEFLLPPRGAPGEAARHH
jgi:site-specific recombinase